MNKLIFLALIAYIVFKVDGFSSEFKHNGMTQNIAILTDFMTVEDELNALINKYNTLISREKNPFSMSIYSRLLNKVILQFDERASKKNRQDLFKQALLQYKNVSVKYNDILDLPKFINNISKHNHNLLKDDSFNQIIIVSNLLHKDNNNLIDMNQASPNKAFIGKSPFSDLNNRLSSEEKANISVHVLHPYRFQAKQAHQLEPWFKLYFGKYLGSLCSFEKLNVSNTSLQDILNKECPKVEEPILNKDAQPNMLSYATGEEIFFKREQLILTWKSNKPKAKIDLDLMITTKNGININSSNQYHKDSTIEINHSRVNDKHIELVEFKFKPAKYKTLKDYVQSIKVHRIKGIDAKVTANIVYQDSNGNIKYLARDLKFNGIGSPQDEAYTNSSAWANIKF